MSELFTCKQTNRYILFPCRNANCNWYLHSEQFCNCTFIAAYFGPFTLLEVGIMMNLSRERVRQIEENALAKLKRLKEQGVITEPVLTKEDNEYELSEYLSNLF